MNNFDRDEGITEGMDLSLSLSLSSSKFLVFLNFLEYLLQISGSNSLYLYRGHYNGFFLIRPSVARGHRSDECKLYHHTINMLRREMSNDI